MAEINFQIYGMCWFEYMQAHEWYSIYIFVIQIKEISDFADTAYAWSAHWYSKD